MKKLFENLELRQIKFPLPVYQVAKNEMIVKSADKMTSHFWY